MGTPQDHKTHRLLAILEVDDVDLIKAASKAGRFQIVGVHRLDGGSCQEMAKALQCEPVSELRQSLPVLDIDGIWISGRHSCPPELLQYLMDREISIYTEIPRPPSIQQWLQYGPRLQQLQVVGLFADSAASTALFSTDHVEDPVWGMHVTACCQQGSSSLLARMFDAFDMIYRMMGMPEQITAILHPGAVPVVDDEAGLLQLTGTLSITARFGSGRFATVIASDQMDSWSREVTIIREQGCRRFCDAAIQTESLSSGLPPVSDGFDASPWTCMGESISRHLQGLVPLRPPEEQMHVLALCETARLSARTRETELPLRMLELVERI